MSDKQSVQNAIKIEFWVLEARLIEETSSQSCQSKRIQAWQTSPESFPKHQLVTVEQAPAQLQPANQAGNSG